MLDRMNEIVSEVVGRVRKDIAKDPLAVLPVRIMKEINDQIPEIKHVLTPAPITIQLDGLRVKLPYDEFHKRVENIEFDEGPLLSEVAKVMPSKMKNYILIKIQPKSEVGFVI